MPTKKPGADSLVIVAHPDDETIFFGGLLMSKKWDWRLVCVTDGNADGLGSSRREQFRRACKKMIVKQIEFLDFPDAFEKRIDVRRLTERLSEFESCKKVFTHGVLGEYGHPHHQDVSYAVHTAFKNTPVYSVAYNVYPDIRVPLSPSVYKKKVQALWDIYSGEVRRFINFLPASWDEGFVRVNANEVSSVYKWITQGRKPDLSVIKTYKWLIPYLEQGGGKLATRPF